MDFQFQTKIEGAAATQDDTTKTFKFKKVVKNTFLEFSQDVGVDTGDEFEDLGFARQSSDSVLSKGYSFEACQQFLAPPDRTHGRCDQVNKFERSPPSGSSTSTDGGEPRPTSTSSSEYGKELEDKTAAFFDPNRREKATLQDFKGLTSVMVRGIPSKLSQRKLVKEVDSLGFSGKYDFLYLPTNPRNQCNRGFAFLNLVSSQVAMAFFQKCEGHRIRHFDTQGCLQVVPARIQGFEENMRQFDAQDTERWSRRCQQRPIIKPYVKRRDGDQASSSSVAAFTPQTSSITDDATSPVEAASAAPAVRKDEPTVIAATGSTAVPQEQTYCDGQIRFCPFCGQARLSLNFKFCINCGVQFAAY
eukprot:TRINITY_DN101616_c0_g1_i1.p1 TRINITY_DN101616_c0_g1~~TRINITY_DN101616_c0_g1_i1.p1  ORF type:complete len:360 (-),score=72.86 TRINITY_DN101616_c0_g1_i1:173-1252(-)